MNDNEEYRLAATEVRFPSAYAKQEQLCTTSVE